MFSCFTSSILITWNVVIDFYRSAQKKNYFLYVKRCFLFANTMNGFSFIHIDKNQAQKHVFSVEQIVRERKKNRCQSNSCNHVTSNFFFAMERCKRAEPLCTSKIASFSISIFHILMWCYKMCGTKIPFVPVMGCYVLNVTETFVIDHFIAFFCVTKPQQKWNLPQIIFLIIFFFVGAKSIMIKSHLYI